MSDYLQERLKKMGVTDVSQYTVTNYTYGRFKRGETGFIQNSFEIFQADNNGDLRIYYPTLHGLKTQYDAPGTRIKKDYYLTRYANPIGEKKYHFLKGAGHQVFIPPAIIDKYQAKEKINTLVLTEGAIKAFTASLHGLDILGLASITGLTDRITLSLHDDIKEVIRACDVRRVIYLVDGDCLTLTSKPLDDPHTDLFKKPNAFYNSVATFAKFMEEFPNVEKYFAHVKTSELADLNNPKGLDDLLHEMAGNENEVIKDLTGFTKKSWKFFNKLDLINGTARVFHYFNLHNVDSFFTFYSEQRPEIRKKPFKWNGSKYLFNEEKNICQVQINGDPNLYFRVNDDYYKNVEIPNKHGDLDRTFRKRGISTIIQDHGKDFIKHIPKYEAFCNRPSHTNYQAVINNCFNMYAPFEHTPAPGDCETTLNFLRHIFGTDDITFTHPDTGKTVTVNGLDLGIDYIQILYKYPQQTLPILCLVSKENETGKTTFCKYLKMLFTQNVAFVGNAEISNDFNASYAGKLLVVVDEARIDKVSGMEKIKALATADKMFMNSKGKDHAEIDIFSKWILNSNYEEDFIFANEYDKRFWVRKVPVIRKINTQLVELLQEEIPAFLHFLNNRKLATENLTRSWFHPDLLKTEALKKIIERSRPAVEKEIRYKLRELFWISNENEIIMSVPDLQQEFFRGRNFESEYIHRVLRDNMKVQHYKAGTSRYRYPRLANEIGLNKSEAEVTYRSNIGRPYVFRVTDFLTETELLERSQSEYKPPVAGAEPELSF